MRDVTKKRLQIEIDYESHHHLWTIYRNEKLHKRIDMQFTEFCLMILKNYINKNKVF